MSESDHVRVMTWPDGRYRMFCEHCGDYIYIRAPVNLAMAALIMKEYGRAHKTCRRPADPEIADRRADRARNLW